MMSFYQHVTIMRKGLYYRLDVVDIKGEPLSPQMLEKQIQWIVDDADQHQGWWNFCFCGLYVFVGGKHIEITTTTSIDNNMLSSVIFMTHVVEFKIEYYMTNEVPLTTYYVTTIIMYI